MLNYVKILKNSQCKTLRRPSKLFEDVSLLSIIIYHTPYSYPGINFTGMVRFIIMQYTNKHLKNIV